MNKKFSTLMAGLLLAGSFPVAAQFCPTPNGEVAYRSRMVKAGQLDNVFKDVKKINPNYYYQLQVNPASLGLGTAASTDTYVLTAERDYSTGKIYLTAQKVTDATLTHSLWQISVQGREVNSRVYSFKNKETGFELTFDHFNALQRGVVPGTSNSDFRIPTSTDYNDNTDIYKTFSANYGWTYAKDGLMDGCNTWWAWYTSEDNGVNELGYKKVWSYFHNTDSVMALRAILNTDNANYKDKVYHPATSLEGYVDEALRDGGIDGTATKGYAIVAIKESKAKAQDFLRDMTAALQIKPVVAGAKVLNAAEINTMIDADGSFLKFGENSSENIRNYDEWKDAGNKGASSTKFTVYDPKTGEPLDIYSNPFDNTFKAVEAKGMILSRNHLNSSYAGYDVLFETKTPIDTDQTGAKKYGYLFVSEYPYEGQAFQGIYNGLQVTVAPYSYLDNPNVIPSEKKTVLQYNENETYIDNKSYTIDGATGRTPDALQARYHWKVTYYATNDSVVLEPLNASRMSQSDFTQGKKFEETTLATAQVSSFLNTINAGVAYGAANANTMFNKAAGVPVALYAMNFGPSSGDVKSFLTVGYASGMTLDGQSAVEASNPIFAATWGNKVVSTNAVTGAQTMDKESGNPAWVTNKTLGKEYQSAMELLLRFNREYPYLQRATKETGLYFINLTNIDPSNVVTESYENGSYVVMDMGGHVVYDVAQKEQNFSHMPATQWVVEQQPCDITAAEGNVNYNKYPTVRIYNREFAGEPVFDGQLYVDAKGGLFTINHREYGKDAKQYNVDKHGYMKRTLNCNDFYVFNPVQDINTLGYFNEENEVLRNSTYQFQHMFDMGVDKFLGIDNLKADMDTLRLVADGADVATQFELFRSEGLYPTQDSAWVFNESTKVKEYVGLKTYSFSYRDSLEYGYPSEAANAPQLYKTFYKIKVKDNNQIDNDHKFVAIKNQHKYVVADEATINSDPTLEFAIVSLKENNCLDGTHGYALVNAPKIILAENVAISELKNLEKEDKQFDDFNNEYTVYYVDSDKNGKFDASKDKVMVTIYEDGKLNNKQLTGKLAIEEISLDAKIAALCETTTSVFKLVNSDRPLYATIASEYVNNDKMAIDLRTIERQGNESLFEDSSSNEAKRWGMNYLGAENMSQITNNEGFYVDAVAKSMGTRMPQYLLAVAADSVPAYEYCNCGIDGHVQHGINSGCGHSENYAGYVEGRFLVNYNDSVQSALIDKVTNADKFKSDNYTRLGFVEAVHRGDSLYVLKYPYTLASLKLVSQDPAENGKMYICPDSLAPEKKGIIYDIVPLDGKHNNAVFSFRNTGDAEGENGESSFLIESNDSANKDGKPYSQFSGVGSFAGAWIKIHNNVPVLAKYYSNDGNHNTGDFTDDWKQQGDITADNVTGEFINQGARFTFNAFEKDSEATANETIAASSVIVAGQDGAVVVKGAEGKNVIVSTILGKVVANEVLTSDNAQIAAPQGVVVVSVDGESFKVVVK